MNIALVFFWDMVWFYCLVMAVPLVLLTVIAKFWLKNKKFQYTVTGLLLFYIFSCLFAILSVYLSVFKWWFLYEPDGLQFVLVVFLSLALLIAGLMQLFLKKECKLTRNMILIPVLAGLVYQISMITYSNLKLFLVSGILLNIFFILIEIFAIIMWAKSFKNLS